MASLADRYQKRLDAAARRGKSSFRVTRTVKGQKKTSSAITQGTVDAIRGDEEVQIIVTENNTKVITAALGNAVVAALEEIGLVAEGAAKRLCPVDTGRLRNSITHALVSRESVEVGTNVEYAIYVHEGTSKRDGIPFLREAAQNNKSRFEAILRKHLGK